MISISPVADIYISIDPIDFRWGMDRLARCCFDLFDVDPMCGAVFVFRNRRGNAARLLFYDSTGFWLATKRLSKNRFRWWDGRTAIKGDLRELLVTLWDGNPSGVFRVPWLPAARQLELEGERQE